MTSTMTSAQRGASEAAALAGSQHEQVRVALAQHPTVPPAILARLAADPSERVREQAALNPSTPAEVLMLLAEDAIAWVRASVARNPSTPRSALETLIEHAPHHRHSDRYVLAVVAGNDSAPVGVRMAAQLLATAPTGRRP